MTTVENTTSPAPTFESRAARIDVAQRAVGRLDAEPRAAAEELLDAVEAHHAAVLLSLVSRLRADDRGRELLYEAVDDPEVFAAIVDDAAATFASEPVGGSFDRVLGRRDTDANGENRWNRVEHDSLCWPYGLSYRSGRLAIADSGNNRVTVWSVEP